MIEAPEPASSPQSPRRTWGRFVPLIFLLAFMIAASLFVLAHPWETVWDQNFVRDVDLRIRKSEGHWQFQYPRLQWSGGISSNLIVGVFKLIVPTTRESINEYARIFALVCYCGSAYLLASRYLRAWPVLLCFVISVFVSRYPFVWQSGELFAGAFFFTFLYLLKRGARCGYRWLLWSSLGSRTRRLCRPPV